MAFAQGAAILVPVPIEYRLTAVLDGPVAAVVGEEVGGIGGLRGVTGDAVDDLGCAPALAGLFVDPFARDDEDLIDSR